MASQAAAGSSGASSSAAKSGSAHGPLTMPQHRQTSPAGLGKGIEYHEAASETPDVVSPHVRVAGQAKVVDIEWRHAHSEVAGEF